jgi:hypothetical protein
VHGPRVRGYPACIPSESAKVDVTFQYLRGQRGILDAWDEAFGGAVHPPDATSQRVHDEVANRIRRGHLDGVDGTEPLVGDNQSPALERHGMPESRRQQVRSGTEFGTCRQVTEIRLARGNSTQATVRTVVVLEDELIQVGTQLWDRQEILYGDRLAIGCPTNGHIAASALARMFRRCVGHEEMLRQSWDIREHRLEGTEEALDVTACIRLIGRQRWDPDPELGEIIAEFAVRIGIVHPEHAGQIPGE